MATNINVGDRVYVPCQLFSALEDKPSAFYRTSVVAVEKNSIKVNLPDQEISRFFGVGRAHRDLGILIVTIGDFKTESTLLDPLSKSVLQYTRLLMTDDLIRHIKLRSIIELQQFWEEHKDFYTHIILIGHGTKAGLMFGVDGTISAEKFNDLILKAWGGDKKTIISLCCNTGYASFGQKLSSFAQCKHFIGPFHSVHGAIASQFCQTFLAYHLLEGRSTLVAFKKARTAVPGATSFRLWENNQLKAGRKT